MKVSGLIGEREKGKMAKSSFKHEHPLGLFLTVSMYWVY